jgi:signal transduction histidine kinase
MTIIRIGKMLNIEEKETYNDRPDTWVSTFKMPLYDKVGKIIGTFGISRDITTQQLYQSEIKLKNEELQKLNAEKDKFFSIIAHDLRNPLGAFMSYTELMVEDIDNLSVHEIKDMAVDMKNSAYNLFNLLENLLEWSRIERGIIGFEPKSYNLMTKINESMQSVLESANKKGIGIGFNVPKDMKVYTDENMLKSTIRNLATNAVKFTPKGGKITLTAKPVYDNFVEISFRDTGIGMNKDILDKLFRLDAHTSRPGTEGEPSSGLGLILCKDFIDKQGGKIWVESEPGKGSVFYFTIPNNEQG